MSRESQGHGFKPSPYQSAIFDWIEDGTGNALIEAVAGSGKTTTIVQGLERISAQASCLFLAFNRDIATELAAKVPANCEAKTFHKTALQGWRRFVGRNFKIDGKKVRWLAQDNLSPVEYGLYNCYAIKLVGLAKSAGVGYLVPDTFDTWWELADHHDLYLDHQDAKVERAIEIARYLLELSNAEGERRIDFDDMLYLPLIHDVSFYYYDWVLVDEAQDTNQVQLALLERLVKPETGRLIAVGDSAQAIYGFRGADSDAMNRIRDAFDATVLPLSVSYRCAKAVVAAAKEIVPHIEPFDGAPDGIVEDLTGEPFDKLVGRFEQTDAVVCRNTAPLIDLVYKFFRADIPAKVLGREIGKGLSNLIKKLGSKDIEALEADLDQWADRETAKHLSKDREDKAQNITDKHATLTIIIENLPEKDRSIDGLHAAIDRLFTADESGRILTLCTIHKSKGLEWPRVWILGRERLLPSKWARKQWQKSQEANLEYVAITRAKKHLIDFDIA
jgi:superfamily I DNA/RNA helicase